MKRPINPIIQGNDTVAYRDPACIYFDGIYRLFMTRSEKREGYMYNTLAISESRDLISWSEPKSITEQDTSKNYCSPGNVFFHNGSYYICVTSYPMPLPYEERGYADNTARLFFITTKDFKSFSEPQIIMVKGDTPPDLLGRMIDPYVFRDKDDEGLFHLFFKQNGVSHSTSRDLVNWTFEGRIDGGENACVVISDGEYVLIHSPENGIGIKRSRDLSEWRDLGIRYLGQEDWSFADGRITAAFALESPKGEKYRYTVFFHGSIKESRPETHGSASIGIAYTNDFETFYY